MYPHVGPISGSFSLGYKGGRATPWFIQTYIIVNCYCVSAVFALARHRCVYCICRCIYYNITIVGALFGTVHCVPNRPVG